MARKVPQLVDVRDESTDLVRIVLEVASGADPEKALAYLFKHTPLQQNFNVNLTALVPTGNPLASRPAQLSLREMLQHFIDFRIQVTRAKLNFERNKLAERVHLLEGLAAIVDVIPEVIAIVRSSSGRSDAAKTLQKRFKLTEVQAFFIVDLRIYQLSRTSIDEITAELEQKTKRIKEIDRILKSEQALKGEIAADLQRLAEKFGDARRCQVVSDFEEPEFDKEEYIQHEDAFAVVSRDGWLKRIRTTNDPQTTRLREGDSLFFVGQASTRDGLVLLTNQGNMFGTQIIDLTSTTGYGEPVQKMFRFNDGEQIVAALILKREENGDSAKTDTQQQQPSQEAFDFAGKAQQKAASQNSGKSQPEPEYLLYTSGGYGFRLTQSQLGLTKKVGKRLIRLSEGDCFQGVAKIDAAMLLLISEQGYGSCFLVNEAPALSLGSKGVILQKIPQGDSLRVAVTVGKQAKVSVLTEDGKARQVDVAALTIGSRAKRGLKVVKRGGRVRSLA